MKQKIAGITFQKENVLQLASENNDFSRPKKELLEEYFEGDRVFEYDFHLVKKAKLKPEPENQHDPNAIAVYAQHPLTMAWLKIGYIKSGSTAGINMEADYSLEMGGGAYKGITEDGIESGETNFWASIEEYQEGPARGNVPEAATMPEEIKPEKSKKTALLLCIFLGIFGAHKFYEGKTGTGILYLLTGGLLLVGWISDIFKILKYPDVF